MSYFECLSSVTVHFNPDFRLVCCLKLSRYSLLLNVKKMKVTKWRLKTWKLCILLSLSSSFFFFSSVRHSETHTKYRERTKTHTTEYWFMSHQKNFKKWPAKGRNYFSLARRTSNSNVPNLQPRTESVGHQNTPIIDTQGLVIDFFFLNLSKPRGYASYQ